MWLTTVAERVAALRGMAGLTQREASRLAGLKSQSHIGMIEAGDGEVTVDTAEKIAVLFGADWPLIMRGTGKPPKQSTVQRSVAAARLRQRGDDASGKQGAA